MILKNANINGKGLANIVIKSGVIVDISDEILGNDEIIDLNGKTIIPGVIDPHVHCRDMEQAYKEDWESVSRAAVFGGITSIFDMPNTKPATTTFEGLQTKREFAKKSVVNAYYNFGAANDNLAELEKLGDIADVPAIKLYMSESSSNALIDSEDPIRKVFEVSKRINKPVILHCELQRFIDDNMKVYEQKIFNHNKIRSREAAVEATRLVLNLAEQVGNVIYIAHVATSEEIQLIRTAKNNGVKVFCETTPHHFLLSESVLSSVGNFGKVNPPIRTVADNLAIYEGILDGTVDTIGSDHAPHSLDEKCLEFSKAPSGFPGLETLLPVLLNEVSIGRLTLDRVIELTSGRSAEIFGLVNRGRIEKGFAADLTVIDLDMEYLVVPEKFFTKAKYSPFAGMRFRGCAVMTFVNGVLATDRH